MPWGDTERCQSAEFTCCRPTGSLAFIDVIRSLIHDTRVIPQWPYKRWVGETVGRLTELLSTCVAVLEHHLLLFACHNCSLLQSLICFTIKRTKLDSKVKKLFLRCRLSSIGRADDKHLHIHSPGGAFSAISFRRAVMLWAYIRLPETIIDRKLRPLCTMCVSFNMIALVYREK